MRLLIHGRDHRRRRRILVDLIDQPLRRRRLPIPTRVQPLRFRRRVSVERLSAVFVFDFRTVKPNAVAIGRLVLVGVAVRAEHLVDGRRVVVLHDRRLREVLPRAEPAGVAGR